MKYLIFIFLLSSCAIRHHVQVSDVIRKSSAKLRPFNVKVSATGVNVKEAGELASFVTKDNDRAREIAEIIALFQMGPRTGNPVFEEKYADIVPKLILAKCPQGNITGLLMVRETAKYPLVSGEIINVSGYCQ